MLGPTATRPPHFDLDNTCKPICGACFALTVGVTHPIHSYHEFSSSDKNLEVATQATAVLAKIASHAEGAQAVVDARILDHLDELWRLPDRSLTCRVLHDLSSHKSTRKSVVSVNQYQKLVALLGLGCIPIVLTQRKL
jgi:hypothetical protein